MADVLLLPISEKKQSPYWNSTSALDFDPIIVIGVSFCNIIPNFVAIGSSAELRYHRFLKMKDGGDKAENLFPASGSVM